MKLSKRLKHIESLIETNYDHIWDCCCDHGFLGTQLLIKQTAKNIHFVDIVPELIEDIEKKLGQFHPEQKSNWNTHCIDVAKLPLTKHQGKHLIIIAGIGGDLMLRVIDAIYRSHSKLEIDFLLCPVNRQFALREKLNELNFSLRDEILIEDKSRFYEILLVSNKVNKDSTISPVGEKIWQSNNEIQAKLTKAYLNKTLNHYQRIRQNNANNSERVVAAYRNVKLKD